MSSPKGKLTWRWSVPSGNHLTFFKRPKGMKFGGHFHKGGDPSKNPEIILFIAGRLRAEFLNLAGIYQVWDIDASRAPVELIIYPNVLHRMEALEDCEYLEIRLTPFDPQKPDTYDAKDFPIPTDW